MKLISVNDTSRILGLHVMSIYKMVKEGKLKAVKIGRRVLISEAEIDRLIESGGQR